MFGNQFSTQSRASGFLINAAVRHTPSSYSKKGSSGNQAALTIHDFKRQSCESMRIGIGPRSHADCPHRVTFQEFYPDDNDSLNAAISASYKQVFGNFPATENERCTELEAQLLDGRITVRDFVNGLAKSPFYKQHYFHSVSPQRGIELNVKHLLGRPILNQEEVADRIAFLAENGYDALIDSITNSAEYLEVFGSSIVPYLRTFTSPAGVYTSSFNSIVEIESSYASSDNAIGSKSKLVVRLAQARPATSPSYSGFSYAGVIRAQQPTPGHNPPVHQTVPFRAWGCK